MGMGGDVLFFFLIRCSLFLSEEKKKNRNIVSSHTPNNERVSRSPQDRPDTLLSPSVSLSLRYISFYQEEREGKEKKKEKYLKSLSCPAFVNSKKLPLPTNVQPRFPDCPCPSRDSRARKKLRRYPTIKNPTELNVYFRIEDARRLRSSSRLAFSSWTRPARSLA